MSISFTRILSVLISFCLILEQSAFAQAIDLSRYFANSAKPVLQSDKFRPLHLRYISYDNQSNDFKLLLDKGDFLKGAPEHQITSAPAEKELPEDRLKQETQELMKYFFIGLALPNEKFWVNLRPDSPDNILDPDLEKTDIGRIFLEADVQLKKDTAQFTSPQTPEGKAYWDKLYQKAGELFGSENITIPTITRPWIVPNEIIIREAADNAYIYKATLKVMLEEDYLKSPERQGTSHQHNFTDPRLKELNEYSTQLLRELIIPKLTYQVNTAKRYAPLRQVYYSLILAQWFKQKYGQSTRAQEHQSPENPYIKLIDSRVLTNLTAKEPYDKQAYFKQYQKSFQDGEYNLTEPVYAPAGQSIRSYMSGGLLLSSSPTIIIKNPKPLDINKSYLTAVSSSIVDAFLKEFSKKRDLKDYENIIKRALLNMQGLAVRKNGRGLSYLNSDDGTITIAAQGDSLTFKIAQGIQAKSFAHKYDEQEKILYVRNLKTKKDIGIAIVKSNGKYLLYIDRFDNDKRKFILNYDAFIYDHNEETLTDQFSGIVYELSQGIIDLSKITDVRGIKELLEPGEKTERLYRAIIRLHKERIRALPKERETILEGWGSQIKDAIADAIRLSADEKELLGKIIQDITEKNRSAHIQNYKMFAGIAATHNSSPGGGSARIELMVYVVREVGARIKKEKKLTKKEKDTVKEIFAMVERLAASSAINANELQPSSNSAAEQQKKPFMFETSNGIEYKIIGDFGPVYADVKIVITADGEEKVIKPVRNRDGQEPEIGFAEKLKHPGIVIGELIQDKKGNKFLLMPYIKGETLEYFAKRTDIPLEEKLRGFSKIVSDLTKVLSYLESLGLMYNDSRFSPQFDRHFIIEKAAGNNSGSLKLIDLEQVRELDNPYLRQLYNAIVLIDTVDLLKGSLPISLQNKFEQDLGMLYKKVRNKDKTENGEFKNIEELYELCGELKKLLINKIEGEPALKTLQGIDSSTDSPLTPEKGGIDFTHPDIITQPISGLGSFAGSPLAVNPDLDFEAEWGGIQAVFNAGIRPSARRLAEFAASAAASPLNSGRLDELLGLITDLLRRDEEDEKLVPLDADLKELLAYL